MRFKGIFNVAGKGQFAECLQKHIQFKGASSSFEGRVESGSYVVRAYGRMLASVDLTNGRICFEARPANRFSAAYWDLVKASLTSGNHVAETLPPHLDALMQKSRRRNKELWRKRVQTKNVLRQWRTTFIRHQRKFIRRESIPRRQ